MGRHSSDRQLRFYRSVAGWFLPWALVAAVAVTAMWIAVDAIGQEDLDARPPAGAAGGDEPSPSPSPTPSHSARPTPSPGGGGGDDNGPPGGGGGGNTGAGEGNGGNGGTGGNGGNGEQPPDRPPPLIADGVSVQVLNGTSSATAAEAMATRLQDLGFTIEVVAGATPYDQTTVFWSSDGGAPAARRLARRFGWIAGPKPANLSADVDLHVVVGADEA
jgi:LytR cell envelope-related transcriptional attenuator